METIRTKLMRKRRHIYLAILLFFLVFAAGVFAGNIFTTFFFLVFAGVAAALACVIAMLFFVRCSLWGENLGYALSWPAIWSLSVSTRIRFCQFCGGSLEKELNK